MSLLRDDGVVLRTYRLGEADRIVVVLTEHHGKVRAVAKGVRRTASRFGARLEPLSHVALLLWQGRGDLDTVNQAQVIDHFRHVREDLDRVQAGMAMLEAADQVSQEQHADPQLYRMLVGALSTLDDPARPSALILPAFFLKVLSLDGAAPVMDRCASCGAGPAEMELVAFDLGEGGALCRRCRRGRPISPQALAVMRQILGGELAAALAESRAGTAEELLSVVTDAMETHLDRRLRTVRAAAGC